MQSLDEAAVMAYVMNRTGSVLGKGTILKDDRLPVGSYRADLPVRLNGAPNFRRAPNTPLWACGQPSANGVRTVLNYVRPQADSILWVNLRHEPIVYVNQRPYLLRLLDMTVPGLELTRLDLMESRIVADVEKEADTAGGNVLLHEEVQDGAVVASLEAVIPAAARTPAALFEDLKTAKLSSLFYARVPMSPEEPPSPTDVDSLLSALDAAPANAHIVFNCQLGKGRSTMAQCMALLYLHAKGRWTSEAIRATQVAPPSPSIATANAGMHLPQSSLRGSDLTPNTASYSALNELITIPRFSSTDAEEEHSYRQERRGEFNVITQLVRLLPRGVALKRLVDYIVDQCSQCEHLRLAIVSALSKADASRNSSVVGPYLERAMKALARYYLLILLAAFCDDLPLLEQKVFSKWLASRAELWGLLERAQKNARSALGVADAVGGIPFQRTGSALSAGMILKSDHRTEIKRLPPFAPGQPSPFLVSASPTTDTIKQVIASLTPGETILWVNLREEPTLYLNGKPFSLRSASQPLRNSDEYAGIAVARLEELEARLKKDAQSEAKRFQGGVLVHDESSQGPLSTRWEKHALVQTPAELFHAHKGVLTYTRVPLTPEAAPEPRDFDALRALLSSWKPSSGPIVFADQNGRGRATVAVLSALLVAHYKGAMTLTVPPDAAEIHPEQQFININNLVRALPSGPSVIRQVNYLVLRCGSLTYDLLAKIETLRRKASAARSPDESASHVKRAMKIIARYASLLPFAAYCAEEAPRGLDVSFSAWAEARPELAWLMAELTRRPDELLRRPMPDLPLHADVEATAERIVRMRNGGVLSSGTILKPDHFPGCQRMSLLPHLGGAPNFRLVPGLPVCGVAMPTIPGMRAVLQACNAKRVLWINLREEPVLYVLGTPYVLRNLVVPFANLEYTGIDTERVHDMERRLKEEVLADASRNEGRILLHEEGADGKMTTHLETVDAHSVQTPSEVYAALKSEGLPVTYARVPITDEKPPEPKDFDQLMSELRTHDPTHGAVYVFNCQMGRGRTTTGTVIAAIQLYCLRVNAPSKDAYLAPLLQQQKLSPSPTAPHGSGKDLTVQGEYAEILALVRALASGPPAKEEVDVVIDQCSQMQNLREATAEVAAKANSLEGESRSVHFWRARLYMERYFYLIAFAAYLLDRTALSFSDWLKLHAEIDGILAKGTSLKF